MIFRSHLGSFAGSVHRLCGVVPRPFHREHRAGNAVMEQQSEHRGVEQQSDHRGVRTGATEHDGEHGDIQIFPLNDIDAGYKRNHSRRPDLSANIKVVFPKEEYVGAYLSHGHSKTVFVLRSSSAHQKGKFDGAVLKLRRSGLDIEPDIMKQAEGVTAALFYQCMGRDRHDQYHCWVAERCIPLDRLAVLPLCNKERCVLAACRCIARAAQQYRVCLSDCHYFNFGVRITANAGEHEVVIIDVGGRGIAESVVGKGKVNDCMVKLWKWTSEEILTSPAKTQELWQSEQTLEDVIKRLDTAWEDQPYLTNTKMQMADIDQGITANFSSKFREFVETPQGKLLQLIGRSSVEWMGGAWNENLSEICVRVAEETHTTFDVDEVNVLMEMYDRICKKHVRSHVVERTKEDIERIIAFWWKLQQWRSHFLERNGRYDTAEEELNEKEIQRVKRDWENVEMWWELTPKQQKQGHLPSIYNAVFNNRSGWATVANAIIKYRMPQLPCLRESDRVTEHIKIIDRFCRELILWMKKFAGAAVQYRKSAEYERARKRSDLPSALSGERFSTMH